MRFTYYRTVRLSDTDAAGVVYFAQLLSICHQAYEASLEAAGIDLRTFFSDRSTAIPIVRGSIDFWQPIFCGDVLAIELISQSLSDNEFEIDYSIFKKSAPDKCLAKAKTRHVCIEPTLRRRKSLPETMIKWLMMDKA
jgi:1,4-dihydroxy-2-naphthoyl-CoA hydrolase